MRPIDAVLARLDDPRPNGKDRWRCRCPACGGNRSALSIGIREDDALLMRCWKGCDVQSVVMALGLSLADLFPQNEVTYLPRSKRLRLMSPSQCIDVIEFECQVVWTAAWNLASGHCLTPDDLERLSTAAQRIQAMIDEVRS